MNTMIKIVADAQIVADRAALCSQATTPVDFGGTALLGTNGADRVRVDRDFDNNTDKHSSLGTAPPLST